MEYFPLDYIGEIKTNSRVIIQAFPKFAGRIHVALDGYRLFWVTPLSHLGSFGINPLAN
jgi:hypothetical protein